MSLAPFDPCGCGSPRPARMSSACKQTRVCVGKNCSAGHCGNERVDRLADAHQAEHGKRVLACTTREGLCATCARTPDTDAERELRFPL